MSKNRLTPSICRRQDKRIVIDNYEAAIKVLMTHEQGVHPVKPSEVDRAKKQRAICYNDLRRRGMSEAELDYEPELKPHEISTVPRQWRPADESAVAPAEDTSAAVTPDHNPSQEENPIHAQD